MARRKRQSDSSSCSSTGSTGGRTPSYIRRARVLTIVSRSSNLARISQAHAKNDHRIYPNRSGYQEAVVDDEVRIREMERLTRNKQERLRQQEEKFHLHRLIDSIPRSMTNNCDESRQMEAVNKYIQMLINQLQRDYYYNHKAQMMAYQQQEQQLEVERIKRESVQSQSDQGDLLAQACDMADINTYAADAGQDQQIESSPDTGYADLNEIEVEPFNPVKIDNLLNEQHP